MNYYLIKFRYEGQFKCNKMEGDGIMFWGDGSFYEGQF